MSRDDFALTSRMPGLLLWYAGQKGLPVPALVAKYQLPTDLDFSEPGRAELTMRAAALVALGDELSLALQDPHLGLSLAQAVPSGAYGVAEFVVGSSTVLRDAFKNLVRFSALVSPGLRFVFEESGASASLDVSVPANAGALGPTLNEFTVCMICVHLQRLAPAAVLERVWFPHPRPADVAPLERFFGTSQLEFGRLSLGFALPRPFLDAGVHSGNPALNSFLVQRALEALKDRPRMTELTETLRHHLGGALGQGEPHIERLAVRMHMSARTLQRRLADLDTSFQKVLDEVRFDLARGYLGDKRLDVSQVAYLLGYSDLRAFNRAFKRWTGQAPSGWRTRA